MSKLFQMWPKELRASERLFFFFFNLILDIINDFKSQRLFDCHILLSHIDIHITKHAQLTPPPSRLVATQDVFVLTKGQDFKYALV